MDILEKAVNDDSLGITAVGVLAHFYYKGPRKKYDLPVETSFFVHELIEAGYLEADEEYYFIQGQSPDEAELNDLWATFYKPYPGVTSGINVDFSFFKKKYPKGKWKTILRTLPGHLQRQMEQRKDLEIAILLQETHGNRRHGMFIPAWKNLRTYLGNKQGWLENYIVPEQYRSQAPRLCSQNGYEHFKPAYRKYFLWCLQEGKQFVDNADVIATMVLAEGQFESMVEGKVAPFKDYQMHCTEGKLRQHLAECQLKYLGDVYLRGKHKTMWDYAAHSFRDLYKNQ